MCNFPWFSATLMISLSSGTLPVWANITIETGAIPHLADLEPTSAISVAEADSSFSLTEPVSPISMADVLGTDLYSAASLNRLADQMNHRLNGGNEPPSFVIGGLDLSFLEAFLDDNGDLNLPLGLTIYDAMGLTSIGFGTKF